MRQVCSAVSELHSHQIIHRDIKPENIVLHDVNTPLCRMLSSFVILDGLSIATLTLGLLFVALPFMLVLKFSRVNNMMRKLIFGRLGL